MDSADIGFQTAYITISLRKTPLASSSGVGRSASRVRRDLPIPESPTIRAILRGSEIFSRSQSRKFLSRWSSTHGDWACSVRLAQWPQEQEWADSSGFGMLFHPCRYGGMAIHPRGNLVGIPKINLIVVDGHTRRSEGVQNFDFSAINFRLGVGVGAKALCSYL